MIMSGSGERVVFVVDAPGDEALLTGGTIARLLDDDAEVTVLFGAALSGVALPGLAPDAAAVTAARTALGEGDPARWRVLTARPEVDTRDVLGAALSEAHATAVVIAAADRDLRQAAIDAAGDHGVPVFVSSRVSQSTGHRLTAVDVSDQVDRKLHALAAYPNRWAVDGRLVRPGDGSEVLVTGTETFLRGPAAPHPADPEPPTRATRLLATLMGLAAGVLFGVLGTVAHQTTFSLGSVTVPIGLVLALLSAGSLLLGLRLVVGDRLVVGAAALGLLLTVFLLSLRSTGGSVLVPSGVLGSVWTIVPAVFAALVLAWPRIPARAPTA